MAQVQVTNATTADGFLSSVVPTPLSTTVGCQINHSVMLRPDSFLTASGLSFGANGSLGVLGKSTLTLGTSSAPNVCRFASVGMVQQTSNGTTGQNLAIPLGLVG